MNEHESPGFASITVLLLLVGRPATQSPIRRPTARTAPPDESVLGTVEVTGAAPRALPKLAVMPIVTTDEADTTLQLVVKKDLDLSGQFEVVDDNVAPSGLYLHDNAGRHRCLARQGHRHLGARAGQQAPGRERSSSSAARICSVAGSDPAFQHRIESDAGAGPHVVASHDRRAPRRAHRAARRVRQPHGLQRAGRHGIGRSSASTPTAINLHTESPAADTALAPALGPKARSTTR